MSEGYGAVLPVGVSISIAVLCAVGSAIFSGLTLGLLTLDIVQLKLLITRPNKSKQDVINARYAKRILPLRKDGNYLLVTLLTGNVAVNAGFSLLLGNLTDGLVGFLVSTVVITLLGEILPQAVCARHGLRVGGVLAPLVWALEILLYPVVKPIAVGLNWILGEDIGTIYDRKQLSALVEYHGSVVQVLTSDEARILQGGLEFAFVPVARVMTPIDRVFGVEIDSKLSYDRLSQILSSGYSRIPVLDVSSPQCIVGLLFMKDLALFDPHTEVEVRTLLRLFGRDVYAVDDDTALLDLLSAFKKGHTHLAVVRRVVSPGDGDPYYEHIGIITLEDIIEEILQDEIEDEFDHEKSALTLEQESPEQPPTQPCEVEALDGTELVPTASRTSSATKLATPVAGDTRESQPCLPKRRKRACKMGGASAVLGCGVAKALQGDRRPLKMISQSSGERFWDLRSRMSGEHATIRGRMKLLSSNRRSAFLNPTEALAVSTFLSCAERAFHSHSVSPKLLLALLQHMKPVVVRSDVEIYKRGDTAAHAAFVLQGRLKLEVGSEKITCRRGPWTTLGMNALKISDIPDIFREKQAQMLEICQDPMLTATPTPFENQCPAPRSVSEGPQFKHTSLHGFAAPLRQRSSGCTFSSASCRSSPRETSPLTAAGLFGCVIRGNATCKDHCGAANSTDRNEPLCATENKDANLTARLGLLHPSCIGQKEGEFDAATRSDDKVVTCFLDGGSNCDLARRWMRIPLEDNVSHCSLRTSGARDDQNVGLSGDIRATSRPSGDYQAVIQSPDYIALPVREGGIADSADDCPEWEWEDEPTSTSEWRIHNNPGDATHFEISAPDVRPHSVDASGETDHVECDQQCQKRHRMKSPSKAEPLQSYRGTHCKLGSRRSPVYPRVARQVTKSWNRIPAYGARLRRGFGALRERRRSDSCSAIGIKCPACNSTLKVQADSLRTMICHEDEDQMCRSHRYLNEPPDDICSTCSNRPTGGLPTLRTHSLESIYNIGSEDRCDALSRIRHRIVSDGIVSAGPPINQCESASSCPPVDDHAALTCPTSPSAAEDAEVQTPRGTVHRMIDGKAEPPDGALSLEEQLRTQDEQLHAVVQQQVEAMGESDHCQELLRRSGWTQADLSRISVFFESAASDRTYAPDFTAKTEGACQILMIPRWLYSYATKTTLLFPGDAFVFFNPAECSPQL